MPPLTIYGGQTTNHCCFLWRWIGRGELHHRGISFVLWRLVTFENAFLLVSLETCLQLMYFASLSVSCPVMMHAVCVGVWWFVSGPRCVMKRVPWLYMSRSTLCLSSHLGASMCDGPCSSASHVTDCCRLEILTSRLSVSSGQLP